MTHQLEGIQKGPPSRRCQRQRLQQGLPLGETQKPKTLSVGLWRQGEDGEDLGIPECQALLAILVLKAQQHAQTCLDSNHPPTERDCLCKQGHDARPLPHVPARQVHPHAALRNGRPEWKAV